MGIRHAGSAMQGIRHAMEGTPCQDRVRTGSKGPVSLAVVCDGAGSCPGSEAAAELVCRWALEDIPDLFEGLYPMEERELARALVTLGQAALNRAGLGDRLCTMLLFACHRDGRWLAAHIGDGFMFLREDGRTRVLSYPENGEYANETYFLCEPSAAEHLRTCRGRAEGAFQALLTSDGCGDSLYDWEAGRPAPAVNTMCGWLTRYDGPTVTEIIIEQLTELFCFLSDDDLGIAMLGFSPDGELQGLIDIAGGPL